MIKSSRNHVRCPRGLLLATLSLLGACGHDTGVKGPEAGKVQITPETRPSIEDAPLFVASASASTFSQDAQRAMAMVTASHFQSCAPLLRPDENPREVMKQFFGKPESHTVPSKCSDRRSADFDYVSFAKGSFEPDAGRMEVSGGQVNAFQRYNCSGFLAATMAAGGHKYFRSQKSRDLTPRTHEIAEVFKRSDSCFVKPKLSQTASLLPGDVINVSHGHVIRILSVGPDPLGLGRVKSAGDCSKIKPENMDFIFVHSTSDESSGLKSGVRVESAKNASTSLVRRLGQLTREMCEERFKDGKVVGTLPDKKIATTTIGVWPFDEDKDQIFSLRRHVGAGVPECNFEPLSVRGSGCVAKSCYQSVLDL